ncbi:hypothetical protein OPKNFCMD_1462 [Methylobacterium crusticola]|uniref:Uncharacterized protein n=1 Tax=Methylobacterium crusticola TaxID=1697972 RepID=A0ABQ4QTW3_9HYPH|nr:hypothetical protein [Methylobacterium crusticola]GJD48738.1 hypothetical protein OPKNFCMD_1462 [Methylobacterium crusticola]
MRAFVVAVAMAVVLAVAASFVLGESQRFAYQAFATSGARVSNPGTNLVGPRWTGDIKEPGAGHKADAPGS